MTKFACITQVDHLTTFTGPSGEKYVSLKGHPFDVVTEMDIAFFSSNKRFQKVGLLTKLKVQPTKSGDIELHKFLVDLKGVGEATTKVIVDMYENFGMLREKVETGVDLSNLPGVTDKQAAIIRKAVLDKIGRED